MSSFSISPAILVKCEEDDRRMFVPIVEKEGHRFVELKVDYKKRNISWMLVTQKDQGREKYTQAPIASRKSIIDEIVQAGQDKHFGNCESNGLGNSSTTARTCLEETLCEHRFPEGHRYIYIYT